MEQRRTTRAARRICAYCGDGPASTRDHVIPDCLYARSKRTPELQLLTVPSCQACNVSISRDEEEFLAVVVAAKKRTRYADELLREKVTRSLSRPQNLAMTRRLVRGFSQVDVFSAGGVWIGCEIAMRIPPAFPRVLRKIACGLYYYHVGCVVPRGCVMEWRDFLAPPCQEVLGPALREWGRYAQRDPDVFEYLWFTSARPESGASLWVMGFLKSLVYAVGLRHPKVSSEGPAPAVGGYPLP